MNVSISQNYFRLLFITNFYPILRGISSFTTPLVNHTMFCHDSFSLIMHVEPFAPLDLSQISSRSEKMPIRMEDDVSFKY